MTAPVSTRLRDRIAIVTVDNPPVNALSHAVRAGLLDALGQIAADDTVSALVLVCAGRTFIAGADIKEFSEQPQKPTLRELLAEFDAYPKLTLAAIHGTALGGGFETALACHNRVALATAKIGLPESQLGLLPGAGGTQRLPRLIDAESALDMMVSGKPIPAARAHELGLVDAIVDSLVEDAVDYTRKLLAEGAPLRRTSGLAVAPIEAEFFDTYRNKMAQRTRGLEAPERIVRCVEAALTLPFADGLAVERDEFEAAMGSSQSRAMRHLFFAERAVGKVPGIARDLKPRPVESVGVIGAGTMGAGIAMACINAGLPVTLLDSNDEGLARGIETINGLLARQLEKGHIDEDTRALQLELLSAGSDYSLLSGKDLIIEAVFESMAIKQGVFRGLNRVAKPEAILATNTSTLDIDQIATSTARPEQVIGLHFFSPAHVMRLLEIVRGAATNDQTIVNSLAFGKKIGKLGVVVGNCFGFVGNRMLYGYGRENQFLLLEGAAPEFIDKTLTDFGMAMGPNAVGDLAGLDVGYKVRQERSDLPDDPRYYRVADLLAEMGRYGQKTGKGIYRYEAGSRVPHPDPEVQNLIKDEARRLGVAQREIVPQEIVERCIYALINEGVRILEEGIALRAGDIDTIWANGYGFPRYRGGPMCYADTIGARNVYDKICEFRERFGAEYWSPPELLKTLAENDATFL